MILLGHMLADLVEAHTPIQVDRRFNLGGTLVCYNALRLGGLDAYVEYTGTALTTILKEPVQTDPAAVLELVRAELHGARQGRLPRPVRLREHVRHPDAPGAGRAAGHPDDLRPPRPPGRAPPRLRPRVHEPPRRLSRAGPRLRPGVRPRPARDGPQPAVPGTAERLARPGRGRLDRRPDRRARPGPARGRPPLFPSLRGRAAGPRARPSTRLPAARRGPRPPGRQDRRRDDAAVEPRGRRRARNGRRRSPAGSSSGSGSSSRVCNCGPSRSVRNCGHPTSVKPPSSDRLRHGFLRLGMEEDGEDSAAIRPITMGTRKSWW